MMVMISLIPLRVIVLDLTSIRFNFKCNFHLLSVVAAAAVAVVGDVARKYPILSLSLCSIFILLDAAAAKGVVEFDVIFFKGVNVVAVSTVLNGISLVFPSL